MADLIEWTCDANNAVSISLVQPGPGAPKFIHTFHPEFTYPIFGDEQTIFGYKGLQIGLRFACHDLRPNVQVNWKEKLSDASGDTRAVEIKDTLEEWLPSIAFEGRARFNAAVQADARADKPFRPPGECLSSYKIGGKTFEVWHGSLADPAIQEIVQRMQIFVPFFIEGGTYINLGDLEWTLRRWRVFFLYEKLSKPPTPSVAYSIVGYCTTYRYHFYPQRFSDPSTDASRKPHDFKFPPPLPDSANGTSPMLHSRERISQFLILPPYQHQGHGSALYRALVTAFVADPTIHEITVEDPNESFDDLRDYCDLARLRQRADFTSLRINPPTTTPSPTHPLPTSSLLPIETLHEIRRQTKTAPRQFDRLVEMQLLSLTPARILKAPEAVRQKVGRNAPSPNSKSSKDDEAKAKAKAVLQREAEDRTYHLWRLLVKQRLYKRNRDHLIQMDQAERHDKLDETLDDLEADYTRLLRAAELSAKVDESGGGGAEAGVRHGESGGAPADDDDDDAAAALDGGPGSAGRQMERLAVQSRGEKRASEARDLSEGEGGDPSAKRVRT